VAAHGRSPGRSPTLEPMSPGWMDDGTDSGEADQTHGFKGSFIWSGPSVGIIVRLLYRMMIILLTFLLVSLSTRVHFHLLLFKKTPQWMLLGSNSSLTSVACAFGPSVSYHILN
jgi:hypothetical protein